MAVLEQITNMKNNGMSTGQIIQSLKEQGISPKEINEALSQSDVKSELTRNRNQADNQSNYNSIYPRANRYQNQDSYNQVPEINQGLNNEQMDPSMMDNEYTENQMIMQPSTDSHQEGQYTGGAEGQYAPENYQEGQYTGGAEGQYAPENYQQYQENYPAPVYEEDYPEYAPNQAVDVETINDLASQIIDEKVQQLKKEIGMFSKFRKESEEKVNSIEKRLEKIENNLNELQMSIIRKMGDYGDNIENISNELRATQSAFSKVLDPLIDNARKVDNKDIEEMNNIDHKKEDKKNDKRKRSHKDKSDSFEDYLR